MTTTQPSTSPARETRRMYKVTLMIGRTLTTELETLGPDHAAEIARQLYLLGEERWFSRHEDLLDVEVQPDGEDR